jgi:lysophospholipase L1-like esterase
VTVVVSGILPRGEGGLDGEADIATTNQALREAAEPGRYSYFDAHDQFVCKDSASCALMRPPNYVHPTPKGYDLLTNLLQKHIASLR